MLKCDKCGKIIPEGSNFCPNCADAVTDADRIVDLPSGRSPESGAEAEPQRIYFVCPRCEAKFRLAVSVSESNIGATCPECHGMFAGKLVRIRSKTFREDAKGNRGRFSVRVTDVSDRESAVEFTAAGRKDFELRPRDIALFSYFNGELKIVQNMTLGRYRKVSKPPCYVATYLYGADSREVRLLRSFRDGILEPSPVFSRFIPFYYSLSPWLIRRLGNAAWFREVCRVLAAPIVFLVERRTVRRWKSGGHPGGHPSRPIPAARRRFHGL
jgi:Zn-finger nucleic acid-binding protein